MEECVKTQVSFENYFRFSMYVGSVMGKTENFVPIVKKRIKSVLDGMLVLIIGVKLNTLLEHLCLK